MTIGALDVGGGVDRAELLGETDDVGFGVSLETIWLADCLGVGVLACGCEKTPPITVAAVAAVAAATTPTTSSALAVVRILTSPQQSMQLIVVRLLSWVRLTLFL